MAQRFVLDTNVLVAAVRSPGGASFALMRALPLPDWELVLSVPLYLEWQDVLLRPGLIPAAYAHSDILALCRYLASVAHPQDIYFRWPSFLPDSKDDMLLELAVAAGAHCIVTHNARHFRAETMDSFGITVLAPAQFLRILATLL